MLIELLICENEETHETQHGTGDHAIDIPRIIGIQFKLAIIINLALVALLSIAVNFVDVSEIESCIVASFQYKFVGRIRSVRIIELCTT